MNSDFDRKILALQISIRICRRRKFLQLTQRDLARMAGVSYGTIAHIELGKVIPGGAVILGLARALEMTPNEILGWPGK